MNSHPIIDDLRAEHREMRLMFSIIDEEMKAFDDNGDPDFDRLLAAVEFCHAYPGAKHHPKEDILYARMMERYPDAAGKIGSLKNEHHVLGDYTRRFKSAIERILRQENIARDQVSALARDYTDMLKRHMRVEEALYFPAALAVFNDADWVAVGAEIDAMTDTPSDPAIEARFEKIRATFAAVEG